MMRRLTQLSSTRCMRRVIAASLRSAVRREAPFPNWRLADVLPEPIAKTLAQVKVAPAREAGSTSGSREMHNASRSYFAGEQLRTLPGAREVAKAFQAPDVVRMIMALTGAALIGTYLRIEYAVDVEGFWLEPHTDLGVKAFTLLLQLGLPGQERLGTDLYHNRHTWAERAPFEWNSGIAFVPSDRTWHGFEPRPLDAGARHSIIVNYVTDEWRSRDQLAFPDTPVGLDTPSQRAGAGCAPDQLASGSIEAVGEALIRETGASERAAGLAR